MAYYTPWFFIFLGRKVECPAFYLPFLYSAFDTHGRLSDSSPSRFQVTLLPGTILPKTLKDKSEAPLKSILVHSCCAVLQGISKT